MKPMQRNEFFIFIPIFYISLFQRAFLILLLSEVFKHIWWIPFQVWPQGNQILSMSMTLLTTWKIDQVLTQKHVLQV
jgi:hypothetical protein